MSDLIERLEKATGPDRILDALLEIAFGRSRPAWAQDTGSLTVDSDWVRISPNGAGWYPDKYTASIDTALMLVRPEDGRWEIGCGKLVQYWASLYTRHGRCDGEVDSTPAIALCIAALKARAAIKSAEGAGS